MVYSLADNGLGKTFLGLTCLFMTLCLATTIIRMIVRSANRLVGTDDYLACSSMVLLIVQWVFIGLVVEAGLGASKYDLDAMELELVSKYMWFLQVFLFINLPLPKISICVFIMRIKNYGWLKWFLYGLMAGLFIANMACVIILLAECRPVSAYWKGDTAACWDPNIYDNAIWASVAFSIFSDVACTLLPIIVLWNVKVSWKIRLGITGLMSIGLLATIAAIVRAIFSPIANKSSDRTKAIIQPEIWAMLEQVLALLGANCALARNAWTFFSGRRSTAGRSNSRPLYHPSGSAHMRLGSASEREKFGKSQRGSLYPQVSDEALIVRTTDVYVAEEARANNEQPKRVGEAVEMIPMDDYHAGGEPRSPTNQSHQVLTTHGMAH